MTVTVYNQDQINQIVKVIGDKIDYDTLPERVRDRIRDLGDSNVITDAELDKLQNTESNKYKGKFETVADIPTEGALFGDFAVLDGGANLEAKLAIYDQTNSEWVVVGAADVDIEASIIRTVLLGQKVFSQDVFEFPFVNSSVPAKGEMFFEFPQDFDGVPKVKLGVFATEYTLSGVREIKAGIVYRAALSGTVITLERPRPLASFTPRDWIFNEDTTSPATVEKFNALTGSTLNDTNSIHVGGLFKAPILQALSLMILFAPTSGTLAGKKKKITIQTVNKEGVQIGSDAVYDDFIITAGTEHDEIIFPNVIDDDDLQDNDRVRFVITVDAATDTANAHEGSIHIAAVEVL